MEIRRVQITGGSSFMITLPKSWADSMNLQKNDPVMVTPQPDGGLLISVEGPSKDEYDIAEIDADSVIDADALYRELIGAYIAGHSQISVGSGQPLKGAFLEAISKFTQTSIGMEIVEEDENRIVMKDLMDQTEVLPQKNVRREFLLVKRMVSDVFSATENNDLAHLSGMEDRDTEVDRIHWLIQRQSSIHQIDIGLNGRMGIDLRTVTGSVGVSKTLERMGDHAVLIAKHLRMLDARTMKDVGKLVSSVSSEILTLMDGSVSAWTDGNLDLAERCIRDSKNISSEVQNLFVGKSFPGMDMPMSMISGSMRRLAEYCTDICESAINVAMESSGRDNMK